MLTDSSASGPLSLTALVSPRGWQRAKKWVMKQDGATEERATLYLCEGQVEIPRPAAPFHSSESSVENAPVAGPPLRLSRPAAVAWDALCRTTPSSIANLASLCSDLHRLDSTLVLPEFQDVDADIPVLGIVWLASWCHQAQPNFEDINRLIEKTGGEPWPDRLRSLAGGLASMASHERLVREALVTIQVLSAHGDPWDLKRKVGSALFDATMTWSRDSLSEPVQESLRKLFHHAIRTGLVYQSPTSQGEQRRRQADVLCNLWDGSPNSCASERLARIVDTLAFLNQGGVVGRLEIEHLAARRFESCLADHGTLDPTDPLAHARMEALSTHHPALHAALRQCAVTPLARPADARSRLRP